MLAKLRLDILNNFFIDLCRNKSTLRDIECLAQFLLPQAKALDLLVRKH